MNQPSADYRDHLSSAIGTIQGVLERPLPILASGVPLEAAQAVLGIVRLALVQASAIEELGRGEFAEAAGSNFRTLYEAWSDLRFLATFDTLQGGAVEYLMYAYLDAQVIGDTVGAKGATADSVKRLHQASPKHAKLAQARFKGARSWSGLTRTKMLDNISDNAPMSFDLREAYKVYSWDAHGVINAIRDVQIVLESPDRFRMSLAPFQPPEAWGTHYAQAAGTLLLDMWLLACSMLDLPHGFDKLPPGLKGLPKDGDLQRIVDEWERSKNADRLT